MKYFSLFTVLLLSACNTGTLPEQSSENLPARQEPGAINQATTEGASNPSGDEQVNLKKVILPPVAAERAPAASPRDDTEQDKKISGLISSYFDNNIGNHIYIQLDKPLYQPGETIWFKAWDMKTRMLTGSDANSMTVELVSPKGATVLKKRMQTINGSATNDFELPADVQGGEYTLRATANDGNRIERTLIVSAYEAPRMKKKLEFVKKTYGEGEQVSATVEVKRPTGEVMAAKVLTAIITVDGVELPRMQATTNSEGGALVKFKLPDNIQTGNGLLTILVEDGGITESISKSIPILQKKLALAFFAEGGKMIAGLPTRLYFEAKTPLGKPADVEGQLIDDLGNAVAKFGTYKNGLGRIDFTPATGRNYQAIITHPSSVTEKYALPLVEEKGCVLHSYDDLDGQEKALRVAVQCSEKQKVIVAATVRENVLDVGSLDAGPDTPAVIYLKSKDPAIQHAAGVTRVTLFDHDMNPLAERLVFRNRRTRLQVKVETDKKAYVPRGEVALSVSTTDAEGKSVPAELALSVVDDTVLSFADDKSGNLLSKLLLEPELPGKIEEPNFYTDLTESKSALALDLLMGTRGYRRFDWAPVLRPQQMIAYPAAVMREAPAVMGAAMPRMALAAPAPAPAAVAKVPAPIAEVAHDEFRHKQLKKEADAEDDLALKKMAPQFAAAPARQQAEPYARNNIDIAVDKDFARAQFAAKPVLRMEQAWAPVRVFPVPSFNRDYAGPRDDYRETVFWAPSIKTDSHGKANVKFVLSDAITSFRVVSEGVGANLAGRNETTFKSSLPFSISAKLPLEVSAGDKPLIPVTLTNDSELALNVKLDTNFGTLLKSTDNAATNDSLAVGQRKSIFIPLDVTGSRGQSQVALTASSTGLKDEVTRSIPVTPPGFPQLFEKSGQIEGEVTHEVDLGNASKGSVHATIRVYTSPLSTMVSGLEGMLREPSGCFEQTSSTNYPNVMIMQYIRQHDVADPALLERTNKLLDNGYKKLTGFESPKNGYEWFGGDPGHEALTAYGLLEFMDMKDIYGSVDNTMVTRTIAWLKSRRDGNGGYLRDGKALDSFGRASPEVTDAYITWALVSAGETGLDKEVAKSEQLAQTTTDAYQLALATGTLLTYRNDHTSPSKETLAAVEKLARMQSASGAWINADQSITRSGGVNLQIETTSLAILALLKAGNHSTDVRKGMEWLQNNRGGFGQWGATQSTVLALKAMIAYDNATRMAPTSGKVTLLVDGKALQEQTYEAGQREALVFTDFDEKMTAGKHTVTLKSNNGNPLPYSMAIEYRTTAPISSNAALVNLTTKLAKTNVKMGETVRLDATLSNKTQNGQPMTLARLGIPGGLTFQTWQLKELREKGQIAFFETRPREVILYFRDLKPGEVKNLSIDLVATVPGTYTSPASSAYLYYNDTDKAWAAPMEVGILP